MSLKRRWHDRIRRRVGFHREWLETIRPSDGFRSLYCFLVDDVTGLLRETA